VATDEPGMCLQCGAPLRRGYYREHPKECRGRPEAPDRYNGICKRDDKLYYRHQVCTRVGEHRLDAPIS